MIMGFADPFDTLLDLQRSLEATLANDWLQDLTTSRGPFPPINVFQQSDDILAIIELPGVSKSDLQIESKENSIRIFGKKSVDYPEEAYVCLAPNSGARANIRDRRSGPIRETAACPSGGRRTDARKNDPNFGELARPGIDLYRSCMLLDDDVVTN